MLHQSEALRYWQLSPDFVILTTFQQKRRQHQKMVFFLSGVLIEASWNNSVLPGSEYEPKQKLMKSGPNSAHKQSLKPKKDRILQTEFLGIF